MDLWLPWIGVKFKNCEIYIPEVLKAARAMRAGVAIIKPLLPSSTGSSMGKVVIGTVKGDLHDIGKNLVVMMLESGGFEVFDLGVDVTIEKFIEAIQTHQAQVVGLSALLTTTIKEMKYTLETIEEAGIRKQVKVIIGGAPVTEKFAKEIGADGYAPNAASAVDIVRDLLSKENGCVVEVIIACFYRTPNSRIRLFGVPVHIRKYHKARAYIIEWVI